MHPIIRLHTIPMLVAEIRHLAVRPLCPFWIEAAYGPVRSILGLFFLLLLFAPHAWAAGLPVFTSDPTPVTVETGTLVSLGFGVQSNDPATFQWYKDGVSLAGRTGNFMSIFSSVISDSGSYTLQVTNATGSVTSAPIVVTVTPIQPPVVTKQPASVSLPVGWINTFTVWATGTGAISYQWFRNGIAISGATANSYTAKAVEEGGDMPWYTAQVSNSGGSVFTNPTQITVLPPLAPEIIGPLTPTCHIDQSSITLNISAPITSSLPMTYQWYRNGAALPDATFGDFRKYPISASDAGNYMVTATNALGTATSSITVKWDVPGTEWLASQRAGDVVYFLATSPGRIMRYDLAQETWLTIVNLTAGKTPTAFWPTTSGAFVAYGPELVWRTGDLQTETAVTTAAMAITNMVGAGDAMYYYGYGMYSVPSRRISDQSAGPFFSTWYPIDTTARPVVSNSTNDLFVVDRGPEIYRFPFATDGTLGSAARGYPREFGVGNQLFASQNGQNLFSSSGIVLRASDLTYSGWIGPAFDRIDFFADGAPIVLRDRELQLLNPSNFTEAGRHVIPDAVSEIFARGAKVFAFGRADSVGVNPIVTQVPRTSLVPEPTPVTVIPTNQRISWEKVFIDSAGVVNVLSNSIKGVSRWSTTTRSFLPGIPLRGKPVLSDYAPVGNRLLMAYADGTMTKLELNTETVERPFTVIPTANTKRSLLAMDDLAYVGMGSYGNSADFRLVVGIDATLKHLSQSYNWGDYVVWQSATRRAYYIPQIGSENTVEAITVPANGVMPDSLTTWVTALRSPPKVIPPLRCSSDGQYILSANGKILTGALALLGQLPNTVVDGAWLDNGLYTIHASQLGSEIQRWSRTDYLLTGSLPIPGMPVQILRINEGNLAVVTLVNGYLAFHIVPASLASRQSYYNGPVAGAPPTILVPPQSVWTNLTGTATFSVIVSGIGPLTYQWKQNGVNITGATDDTYTTPNVTAGDIGNYTVLASNSSGSTVSEAAVLSLIVAPSNAVITIFVE